jgi:hypothetical protein
VKSPWAAKRHHAHRSTLLQGGRLRKNRGRPEMAIPVQISKSISDVALWQ